MLGDKREMSVGKMTMLWYMNGYTEQYWGIMY